MRRVAQIPTDGFLWNFIFEVFTEIWPHSDIGWKWQKKKLCTLYLERFFCSSECPDYLLAPPSILFNAFLGLFPWGKWLGHEADRSPPSDA